MATQDKQYKEHLLHKLCVFVLQDFSDNTLDIHSCRAMNVILKTLPNARRKSQLQKSKLMVIHLSLENHNKTRKVRNLSYNQSKNSNFRAIPAQKARAELLSTRTHLMFGSDSHRSRRLLYLISITASTFSFNLAYKNLAAPCKDLHIPAKNRSLWVVAASLYHSYKPVFLTS